MNSFSQPRTIFGKCWALLYVNRTLIGLIRKIFTSIYGNAPEVTIDGHRHCTFPYMVTALQYILPEILKNAFK